MSLERFQTGIKRLDVATGGFHSGELIVISGQPAMGKTSFALSVMLSKLQCRSVGFISLQDSLFSFQERLHFTTKEMRNVKFKIQRNTTEATLICGKRKHYFVYRNYPTVIELCEQIAQMYLSKEVDCIIISSMSFIGPDSPRLYADDKEYHLLFRSLKTLAKLMSIPIILLADIDPKKKSKNGFYRHLAVRENVVDRIISIHQWEYYDKKKTDLFNEPFKGETKVSIDKSIYPAAEPWVVLTFNHQRRLFLHDDEMRLN